MDSQGVMLLRYFDNVSDTDLASQNPSSAPHALLTCTCLFFRYPFFLAQQNVPGLTFTSVCPALTPHVSEEHGSFHDLEIGIWVLGVLSAAAVTTGSWPSVNTAGK